MDTKLVRAKSSYSANVDGGISDQVSEHVELGSEDPIIVSEMSCHFKKTNNVKTNKDFEAV